MRNNPDKVAFVFEDQQWTFKEFDKFTNIVANYFYEAGFKKGDTVALFLENRPEMVAFWLGLSKIGCIAALINFNLKMESLSHCVNVSDAKALVFSVELSEGNYYFLFFYFYFILFIYLFFNHCLLVNDFFSILLHCNFSNLLPYMSSLGRENLICAFGP